MLTFWFVRDDGQAFVVSCRRVWAHAWIAAVFAVVTPEGKPVAPAQWRESLSDVEAMRLEDLARVQEESIALAQAVQYGMEVMAPC